mgnify:CR=1 FL=1
MSFVVRRCLCSRQLREVRQEIDRIQNLPDPAIMEDELKLDIRSLQDEIMEKVC